MMNEFKRFHPLVCFLYFAAVIVFSMLLMHPICLAISLVGGILYLSVLRGGRSFFANLFRCLLLIVAAALFNPLFSHKGATILAYFPNGNPLTAESVIYGAAAGAMLAGVICRFSCFEKVVTSDKFIYLFGRIIPSLSLVLSMTLRFVPEFVKQTRKISEARRGMGFDGKKVGVLKRAKEGITILSAMMTWALENSIETADSMKNRGYGMNGRTAFSNFKFEKRDAAVLTVICVLCVITGVGYTAGSISFVYFPLVGRVFADTKEFVCLAAYFILIVLPVIIELWEGGKWKFTEHRS